LKDWWDKATPQGKVSHLAEQYDLQIWAKGLPCEAKAHLTITPQKLLQSYLQNLGEGRRAAHGWSKGDWMVHFAGCGGQAGRDCGSEFQRTWKLVGQEVTLNAEEESKAIQSDVSVRQWAHTQGVAQGARQRGRLEADSRMTSIIDVKSLVYVREQAPDSGLQEVGSSSSN
jgi:hypothetical protein